MLAGESDCMTGCVGALEDEASVDLNVLLLEKSVGDTLFSPLGHEAPNLEPFEDNDVTLSAVVIGWVALSSPSVISLVTDCVDSDPFPDAVGPVGRSTDDTESVVLESLLSELAEVSTSEPSTLFVVLYVVWIATDSVAVVRDESSESAAAEEVVLSGFAETDDDVEGDDEDIADEAASTDALAGGGVAAVFVVVDSDGGDDLSNDTVEVAVTFTSFVSVLCDVKVTTADDVTTASVFSVKVDFTMSVSLPLPLIFVAASVTLVTSFPFVPPTLSVLFVPETLAVALVLSTLLVLFIPPSLPVEFAPPTLSVLFVPPTTLPSRALT